MEYLAGLSAGGDNLIKTSKEFDLGVTHVVQLLKDAELLYCNHSYTSSIFLSITALEEIAKVHVGSFTDGKHPTKENGRNLFRDHKVKHKLVALPTVAMGSRLEVAIGKAEVTKLMNLAKNGGFVKIREDALYFQRINDKLVVPSYVLSSSLSRSLLLFAIEAFDDALVGSTNYSMKISEETDEMFANITNV